jgi:hypothetical protein
VPRELTDYIAAHCESSPWFVLFVFVCLLCVCVCVVCVHVACMLSRSMPASARHTPSHLARHTSHITRHTSHATDVEARAAEASELGERGAYITPRALMSILRLSQVRVCARVRVCACVSRRACVRVRVCVQHLGVCFFCVGFDSSQGPVLVVPSHERRPDHPNTRPRIHAHTHTHTHRPWPSCALTTPSSAATWTRPSRSCAPHRRRSSRSCRSARARTPCRGCMW